MRSPIEDLRISISRPINDDDDDDDSFETFPEKKKDYFILPALDQTWRQTDG